MIYKLLSEPEDADILGCWEKHLGQYTKVIGYSATGAIFLMAPETKDFLVFYPSMPGSNSKTYGKFESVKDFEENVLKDEEFQEYCLYPVTLNDLSILQKSLGALDSDQIYYPKLDPALGGSIELDEFVKGDVWIRTDILGMNRGM